MDVYIITWELYVKIRSMIRYGCQYYHMKIIYEGSVYYVSFILILSYEGHIRRIKVYYVVDFGIITQESYTKDCTMKRNLCRFYHMKIIYEDSIMKCHGRRFYYMRIICLWWFNYEMSWMSILSHEDHIHTKHPIWNVMDIDFLIWETYTKIQLWNIMDVEFYRMRIIYEESSYEISWMSMLHVQRILLWKSWMTMLTHDNHMYTKNQTMKSHGCWCYHMRIIYEESNYDMTVSWMSILSHENHKYTKNELKSHGITWES